MIRAQSTTGTCRLSWLGWASAALSLHSLTAEKNGRREQNGPFHL
jgi:hypothetical protein